jgi:hypothetical protein
MKDVNDQLALWRSVRMPPHWTQRAEAELEAELIEAFQGSALLRVVSLLTVLRERSGGMGACHVLARALAAHADKSREA